MNALTYCYLVLLGSASIAHATAEPLRDPTRPPQPAAGTAATASAAAPRQARLEAVLLSSERAIAIIDGRAKCVGDWVGAARIAAIDHDAVHLIRDGQHFTLRLPQQAIKVRRTASSKDPQ